VQAGILIKFADKSDGAGPCVKTICLSEGNGTGIIPLSSGEKDKIGYIVKFTKTSVRKRIKSIIDTLYAIDKPRLTVCELGIYPAGIRVLIALGCL
jgi:hypothetical protein